MRVLVAVSAVAAALALAGCSKTIDNESLEGVIGSGIEEQTGAEVTSVDCPSGEESETGHTFQCTATAADGTEGTIDVEVTNGDNGDVEWQLSDSSG